MTRKNTKNTSTNTIDPVTLETRAQNIGQIFERGNGEMLAEYKAACEKHHGGKSKDLATMKEFHKEFRPLVMTATGWGELTCNTRFSEWRKAADYPRDAARSKGNAKSRQTRQGRASGVAQAATATVPVADKVEVTLSDTRPVEVRVREAMEAIATLAFKLGTEAVIRACRDTIARAEAKPTVTATVESVTVTKGKAA